MTPRYRIRPVVIREDEPPWWFQAATVIGIGMFIAFALAEWSCQ